MPALYAGKLNGKPNGKSDGYNRLRGVARSSKPPLYKAVFGGRAKLAPSKKYARNSPKRKAFEKIITLIQRRDEPGLADLEKVASFNLATNMCLRHDIELKEAVDEIEFRKNYNRGGSSTVIIKHRDHMKYQLVRRQTFLLDLIDSMSMLFDVQAYVELRNGVLRATFYGIAGNTISAQLAFKMVYNEAVIMGQAFKGNGPRNSYLLGIAAGIWDKAIHRTTTIENEIARARELAATTFSNQTFGTQEEDDSYEPDFNFDIGPLAQGTGKEATGETEKPEDAEDTLMVEDDNQGNGDQNIQHGNNSNGGGQKNSHAWVQNMLILGDCRAKIKRDAEDWLAEQGIKLRAQCKRKRNIYSPEAFAEGKEHSKDIDMGEKKICFALNEHLKNGGREDPLEQY